VLHDPNLAAVHADTIVLLRGGRILASGDPWNVMTQERLTATFDHPVLVSRRTDLDRPLVVPVV
jgi:iron complex transport system ATP-binding protein